MTQTFKRVAGATALALAVATSLIASTSAQAVVPQQKQQVPGYYRLKLGDLELTALYDGYIDLDQKILTGIKAGDLQSLLARMFIQDSKAVQTSVNAFLVHTGTQLVLIDTGTAQCFGPTLGTIPGNLRAAGYEGAQVDAVLLTHMHPDHACGLLQADGKPAFPNATVYVAAPEADFWTRDAIKAQAPADQQPMFDLARNAVAPYRAAGRFKTFTPGDTVLPGLLSLSTPGHTPGHSSYLVGEPGPSQLLVLGDLIHSHATQFARPEISVEFDVDAKAAIASRRLAFDRAAQQQLWTAGAHLPFPGIGHIRADKPGYAWVPVEFGPYRADR